MRHLAKQGAELAVYGLPDSVRHEIATSIQELITRNNALVVLPVMTTRILDTDVQGWKPTPPLFLVKPDQAIQIRIDGPGIVWAEISNDPEWLGWEPLYAPIIHSVPWRSPDGFRFLRFKPCYRHPQGNPRVRIGITS